MIVQTIVVEYAVVESAIEITRHDLPAPIGPKKQKPHMHTLSFPSLGTVVYPTNLPTGLVPLFFFPLLRRKQYLQIHHQMITTFQTLSSKQSSLKQSSSKQSSSNAAMKRMTGHRQEEIVMCNADPGSSNTQISVAQGMYNFHQTIEYCLSS